MFKNRTKQVVVSGIMLALAVIVPQVFHIIPVANTGGVFLPMHIPVLLTGLFCGPLYGLMVGGLSPVISSLITGMPAAVRLPFMVVELMAYGFFIGLFYELKRNTNKYYRLYTSLVDAMFMGRLAYFLGLVVAVYILGVEKLSVFAVIDAVVLGIPGIIIQFIIIPPIVAAVKGTVIYNGRQTLGKTNTFVCKNGKEVFKSTDRGVAPVVYLLENNPEILKGAYVTDKVIGKAAALLLIKGGIKKLYTEVISEHAIKTFEKYKDIEIYYSKKVPYIVNRTKDGMCPMEKATYDVNDPEEAFLVVKETMKALRNGSLSVDAIMKNINGHVPDIFVTKVTDSTNLNAKEFAKKEKKNGHTLRAVFVAEEQTNGRGRLGRSFYSPKEAGIYMSVLVDAKDIKNDIQMITIGTAVAVCDAIKEVCDIDLGIKWVNDLYKNGRKVCGILAEAVCNDENGAIEDIVIGIGINCKNVGFPDDIKDIAGTLDSADTLKNIDRNRLIGKITENIGAISRELSAPSTIEKYREKSIVMGKEVTYLVKGQEKSGIVTGINNMGNLLVETTEGTEVLSSGEVSIKGDWN